MYEAPEQDLLTERRVVGTAPTYLEACEVVDHLDLQNIPREKLTIVAEELRFREEVTGGSRARRTTAHGVLSGGATGLVFGLVFGNLSWIDPLISEALLAVYGLLFGVVVGALLGFAAHRFSGGRDAGYRVGRLRAGRYAVLATEDVADEASGIVQAIGRSPVAPPRVYSLRAGNKQPTSRQPTSIRSSR